MTVMVVGFGVFFADGDTVTRQQLETITKTEFQRELKVINVRGGALLGSDFLTEDENFPAIYLERSAASLRLDLAEIVRRRLGTEITDENFHVTVHGL